VVQRLGNIFKRFADLHFRVQGRGFDLLDDAGVQLGHVEHITWTTRGVWLDGWVRADRITLTCDQAASSTAPDRARPDVDVAQGLTLVDAPPTGFSLRHHGRGRDLSINLERAEGLVNITVPHPALGKTTRAWAQVAGRFLRAVGRATPLALRYGLSRDPNLRAPLKRALHLDDIDTAHVLDPELFADVPAPALEAKITIILPVYNAFDLLPDVLHRALTHTDLPFRLIVVEDASPDPKVRPFLRQVVADSEAEIELIENAENLGFIGSVNRAFARALEHGDHVLLLNSDAFLPQGWASRLFAPILADVSVASATPMSNDAEIFSAPVICQRQDLAPGVGDAIDAQAQRLNGAILPDLPTGVGFCMAINIAFLRQVPAFDTAFGRGYGEEVDWCQKTRALGGRHLGLPSLFVEHRGGASFGSEDKLRLIQANNRIVASRYPTYDREVQAVIQTDPLISARLTLGLAWLGATAVDPVPIYLAHFIGGGAETWLQRRLSDDLAAGPGAVVLRIGGPSRWRVELVTDTGCTTGQCDDLALVERLLQPLTRRRVSYSCGVGDRDPVALPGLLLSLLGATDKLEVLIHDYYPVSPSYTLLDHDDIYRGPVTAGRDDIAHQTHRPDGRPVSLADWQAAWGRLVARADPLVVFSQASADIVTATYPDAKPILRPHEVGVSFAPVSPDAKTTPVLAVLGNLNTHKGAGVVAALARQVKSRDLRLVVIGRVDPAITLPPSVVVHGAYDPAQLPNLIRRHGVTHWLIPSIWPETFSYTTHEALATGLPVLAFDLGGQGEAVARAANGHPVRLIPDANPATAVLDKLARLGHSASG